MWSLSLSLPSASQHVLGQRPWLHQQHCTCHQCQETATQWYPSSQSEVLITQHCQKFLCWSDGTVRGREMDWCTPWVADIMAALVEVTFPLGRRKKWSNSWTC
eukprot:Sspe_Gene.62866::Locus_35589_Transcript_2_3_Confidence_0.727_Length_527::g.62866::m.62866